MHTSTRLTAQDFTYWQVAKQQRHPLTFADCFPHYHELDRIGVVAPTHADGVGYLGRTLLALTTAFYDCHRQRGEDFFDYPQHFAFVGLDGRAVAEESPQQWDAWSWLDVWPANKWIATTASATNMLQQLFDYQINRLFWPRDLRPRPTEQPLADHLYRMLQSRLKSVTYYGPSLSHQRAATVALCGSAAVTTLWQESIARLPTPIQPTQHATATVADHLQPISVAKFITTMRGTGGQSTVGGKDQPR